MIDHKGFAIIKWKDGTHSEAVIYQDAVGNPCIQCANWISSPNTVPYVCNFMSEIEEIITDFEDIAAFYGYE